MWEILSFSLSDWTVSAAVAEEADVLEEDVFPEEAVSCFLSPLNTESVDFPDTPVSSRLQCFVSLCGLFVPSWVCLLDCIYFCNICMFLMKIEKAQWPCGKYIYKHLSSTRVFTFYMWVNLKATNTEQKVDRVKQSQVFKFCYILLKVTFLAIMLVKKTQLQGAPRKTNREKSKFVLQNLEQRYLKEF